LPDILTRNLHVVTDNFLASAYASELVQALVPTRPSGLRSDELLRSDVLDGHPTHLRILVLPQN
jgi:hypothetical protein